MGKQNACSKRQRPKKSSHFSTILRKAYNAYRSGGLAGLDDFVTKRNGSADAIRARNTVMAAQGFAS